MDNFSFHKLQTIWKYILYIIHIFQNGTVEYPCIVLRHLDIGVTEHFGYIFNAYPIGQTDRCGVWVTGGVESDRLRKEKQTEED